MKDLNKYANITKYDELPDIDNLKCGDVFEYNHMVIRMQRDSEGVIVACTGDIEGDLYIPEFVIKINKDVFSYFDEDKKQYISYLDKCDRVFFPYELLTGDLLVNYDYSIWNNFCTSLEMASKYNAGPKEFYWNGHVFHRELGGTTCSFAEDIVKSGTIDNVISVSENGIEWHDLDIGFSVNDYILNIYSLDENKDECFRSCVRDIYTVLAAYNKRNMSDMERYLSHPLHYLNRDERVLLELCFDNINKENRENIVVEQYNAFLKEHDYFPKSLSEPIESNSIDESEYDEDR